TKEAASQEMKKDVSSLRYTALPNWFHEAHLESSTSNAQDTCSADAPESSENSNPTATSTNPLADHVETLAVETPIPTVSSSVPTACLNDSPELSIKSIFRYLKGHPTLGLWYPKESPFDLVAYSDSDYGGASQDRKSTTGGCQFLGRRLISWQCKKQTIVATSTTEAEYVAAASGYENVVDLLTKPFDAGRFKYLVVEHAMCGFVKGNLIIYTTFDSVVNMCINFFHGSDSVQRTHEFIHVYLAFASVYVWIGIETTEEGTKILATVDGEVSGTPTEPHHTPTAEATPSPQHELSSSSLLPFSVLPTAIDEPVSPIRDDSQGEACPTVSGLEAEQDRANITKTSTLPSESTPRVTSLAAGEGSEQHKLTELTDLCTRLQRQQAEMASKINAQELEISQLKARVRLLEDREGGGITQSREDAPIKGRSLDEREAAAVERSTERGSDNTKEMVTVLTSLDAASILTSGVSISISPVTEVSVAEVPTDGVPTGSGMVPTASPIFTTATDGVSVSISPVTEVSVAEVPTDGVPTGSGMVPTTSLIFTTAIESTLYTRRKGKEKMVESETPKKKKLQEQIDVQVARELEEEMARDAQRMNEHIIRDAEIARLHAEEKLQMMIDGLDRNNETVAKYLQEYHQFAAEFPIRRRIELISDLVKYQDNYVNVLKFQTQQRKPLSRKQQRDFYMSVLRSHACWKARHIKGMTLEEIKEKFDLVWKQMQDFIPMGSKEKGERFKRKGLRLEQDSAKKVKTSEEVPKEKLKEMMQLIPVKEIYVEALQVKYPIIDWEVHTEGERSY
nr:putative ribonuclease H-like domain-containing protein [Tanacetum cinerariifolium]